MLRNNPKQFCILANSGQSISEVDNVQAEKIVFRNCEANFSNRMASLVLRYETCAAVIRLCF
jgi:hypothetical protein